MEIVDVGDIIEALSIRESKKKELSIGEIYEALDIRPKNDLQKMRIFDLIKNLNSIGINIATEKNGIPLPFEEILKQIYGLLFPLKY